MKISHLLRNISKQEPRNSHSSVKVIKLHLKTYLLVKANLSNIPFQNYIGDNFYLFHLSEILHLLVS